MAQHEEIVLWLDRRWKKAIEKHLKGETLQEHLETVLDELCNQLPQREYERISRAIQSEAAAQRAEEEAARTYAAYHVTECGQEWYFKTSPGEELLAVGKKLRGYVTKGNGVAPDKFIGMFFGGQPITAKEFDALTAPRMENTGKVRGVFDVNFDKREFSAVHIIDGWQTWAMRDVSVAVYHATRSQFASGDDKWRKLLDHLNAKRSPRRDISLHGIFLSVRRSSNRMASSAFICRRTSMWMPPSVHSSAPIRTMTGSTSMPTTTSRKTVSVIHWS